jgi:hypothetical protein
MCFSQLLQIGANPDAAAHDQQATVPSFPISIQVMQVATHSTADPCNHPAIQGAAEYTEICSHVLQHCNQMLASCLILFFNNIGCCSCHMLRQLQPLLLL